jgi:hypothetical protein
MERQQRVRASPELSAAVWVADRLASYEAWTVGSIVPTGFQAYARIFHPAEGPHEEWVTWAQVAAWSGKVLQAHAEFSAAHARGYEPQVGELPPDLVAALSALLTPHTQTPERCWFCVWDGGWINGPGQIGTAVGATAGECADAQRQFEAAWELTFGGEALPRSRVRLPGRDYVLLEGPLGAVGEIGERSNWQGRVQFEPHSPNLWWPDDGAWCVATDIDLDSTYVGGSIALIDDLLDDAVFEALPVRESDVRGEG